VAVLDMNGKVAVITGGTSGIGLTTAELFVAQGARVVVAGRREARGARLAAALGGEAEFMRADVRVENDVRALIEHAMHRFGRLDCLVNNAGALPPTGGITDVDLIDLDEALRVHVRGAAAGIKHAARMMIGQGGGSIVNVSSIAGIRAGVGGVVYSTAKAAVAHLTRCAAVELGEHGVRVNSVSPGPIVTGIFGKAFGLADDIAEARTEAVRAAFERVLPQVQPLARVGASEDVASAILFLASDEAAFITGHDLVVDGGGVAGRTISTMRAQRAALAEALR